MTVHLDRPNQRLLVRPEAPRAVDFEACQAYLKTRGLALVDIYSERDKSRPAFWIVATTSGHELARGPHVGVGLRGMERGGAVVTPHEPQLVAGEPLKEGNMTGQKQALDLEAVKQRVAETEVSS